MTPCFMKETIIRLLKESGGMSIHALALSTGLSRQIIHRHMKTLLEQGLVVKRGTPPKVRYLYAKEEKGGRMDISREDTQYLEEHWLTITPSGVRREGVDGFAYWCKERKLDPHRQLHVYKEVLEKYRKYMDGGILDATSKFRDTFADVILDGVYYLDFYSIEIFGKTKLGQLLLHGKLSQDRGLIRELAELTKPGIEGLIKKLGITEYAMIPHSLKRVHPLLPIMKSYWNVGLPELGLEKVTDQIPVAQKTLTKMSDRVENARDTIFLPEGNLVPTSSLLLIDDAVGSGATFQETARKIKHRGLAERVYALALVGSLKGFEVVKEV